MTEAFYLSAAKKRPETRRLEVLEKKNDKEKD